MENHSVESTPYNSSNPRQIFDVDAEIYNGEHNTPVGNIVNISRVQDEAGWVSKYYIRITNPIVSPDVLPLNQIRRSFIPYGTITLQRNNELMLVTIDYNPYMRPIHNNITGWQEYILWHINYVISDVNATLFDDEYGFGV